MTIDTLMLKLDTASRASELSAPHQPDAPLRLFKNKTRSGAGTHYSLSYESRTSLTEVLPIIIHLFLPPNTLPNAREPTP